MPMEASGEGGGLLVVENYPDLAPWGIPGPYFRMVREISPIDCLCSELSNNCEMMVVGVRIAQPVRELSQTCPPVSRGFVQTVTFYIHTSNYFLDGLPGSRVFSLDRASQTNPKHGTCDPAQHRYNCNTSPSMVNPRVYMLAKFRHILRNNKV